MTPAHRTRIAAFATGSIAAALVYSVWFTDGITSANFYRTDCAADERERYAYLRCGDPQAPPADPTETKFDRRRLSMARVGLRHPDIAQAGVLLRDRALERGAQHREYSDLMQNWHFGANLVLTIGLLWLALSPHRARPAGRALLDPVGAGPRALGLLAIVVLVAQSFGFAARYRAEANASAAFRTLVVEIDTAVLAAALAADAGRPDPAGYQSTLTAVAARFGEISTEHADASGSTLSIIQIPNF